MFGGVRATARALNKTPSAISKWHRDNNGNVPTRSQIQILKKAQELELDITPKDLIYGREVRIDEILKR